MPRNPYKCDNKVKDHFQEHHTKCTTSKRATHKVTGAYLNKFLHHRPLEGTKKYSICYNLKKRFDDGKIEALTKEDRENYNNSSVIQLKRDGAIPSITPPSVCEPCGTEQQTDRNNRYRRRILIRRDEQNDEKNKEQFKSTCLSNNRSNTETDANQDGESPIVTEHHGYGDEQGKKKCIVQMYKYSIHQV